jgi:CRP-like cAMP-binding protein
MINKADPRRRTEQLSPLGAPAHDALAALHSFAATIECRPGQRVWRREDPLEHWYRIMSGVARRCLVLPNGRRQIVDLMLPGDFFGFTTPEDRSSSLEAVERTTIASYPRHRVEILAASEPQVACVLREMAFGAVSRMQAQVLILGRTTALAKVGAFLLSMEERLANRSADGIELPMSRYDIADYLAISVETVSRALTALKERRAISFAGSRHVRILDHVALEQDERREPQRAYVTPAQACSFGGAASGPVIQRSDDRQPDGLGNGSRLQAAEHPRTVSLDGSHAESELARDGLVRPTRDERVENFALAPAQRIDPAGGLHHGAVALPTRRDGECGLDGEKEAVVVERLLDEVDRARLHRADGCRDVALAGHDDHREQDPCGGEPPLELEAVHPRHANVDQDAAALESRCGVQQRKGRVVEDRVDTRGDQQLTERVKDGGVVVDHVNRSASRHASRREPLAT